MAIDYQRLTALKFKPRTRYYDVKDTMLYALGLGIGADPMDESELCFVTHKHLKALPTLATVLSFDDSWAKTAALDFTKLVHGEQRLRLMRPLEPEGEIAIASRVKDVFDKDAGRGALIVTETSIADAGTWEPIGILESVVFVRGEGGFGGPPGGPEPLPAVPTRAPDHVVDRPTRPNQAILYRLSGDWNPLHSDPEFASRAGFERPILHGLCTYGNAAYSIVATVAGGDPARLTDFAARFTQPVFPGETIRTEIWREKDRVAFQSSALERELIVLGNGMAKVR